MPEVKKYQIANLQKSSRCSLPSELSVGRNSEHFDYAIVLALMSTLLLAVVAYAIDSICVHVDVSTSFDDSMHVHHP
jgi:hypothetical protein